MSIRVAIFKVVLYEVYYVEVSVCIDFCMKLKLIGGFLMGSSALLCPTDQTTSIGLKIFYHLKSFRRIIPMEVP